MKTKKYIINNLLTFLIIITILQSAYLKTFAKEFELKSPAFKNNELIPKKYTCTGEDISPPLEWKNTPSGTKSLVLIVDDPDAPAGDWSHWVLYNIPTTTLSLPENIKKEKSLTDSSKQGINDFKKIGYGGPCPPSGIHRYFFKLYAIDTVLDLKDVATKKEVELLIDGHILEQAELIGKYKK